MSIMTDALIGAEQVQRAAFMQLFRGLNDTITAIEAYMVPSDTEFSALTGREYVATTSETVRITDFHEGHRPSLITAPVDQFPNCCVYTLRSVAAPGSDLYDHQQAWLDSLMIEIMVKSMTGEEEVNRRIKRMAEAVQVTMQSDPTLGGQVHGFNNAPSVIWGDVFTRKENTAYGPHWFWQGARMEYIVRKEANMPLSTGQFAGLDIDQS